MSATRTAALCTTYWGKEYKQHGQNVGREYEDEVPRRVSKNCFQETRHSRVFIHPRSPCREGNERECKKVCDGMTHRYVERESPRWDDSAIEAQ